MSEHTHTHTHTQTHTHSAVQLHLNYSLFPVKCWTLDLLIIAKLLMITRLRLLPRIWIILIAEHKRKINTDFCFGDICADTSDCYISPKPPPVQTMTHSSYKDDRCSAVAIYTSSSLTNLFCTFIWSNWGGLGLNPSRTKKKQPEILLSDWQVSVRIKSSRDGK